MTVPALIYFALNFNAPSVHGWGVPMATDAAFAVAILAMLGKRVPLPLLAFLTALAIIDDLGAIVVIALFYSDSIVVNNLLIAGLLLSLLAIFNLVGVRHPIVYLLGGVLVWVAMLTSGVHATLAGSLSQRLFLPVRLVEPTSLGIILGLVLGKSVGITFSTWLALKLQWGRLPEGVNMKHIFGIALLGGMGFTMAIFIAGLGFAGEPEALLSAKIAILAASIIAGAAGYLWLRFQS